MALVPPSRPREPSTDSARSANLGSPRVAAGGTKLRSCERIHLVMAICYVTSSVGELLLQTIEAAAEYWSGATGQGDRWGPGWWC